MQMLMQKYSRSNQDTQLCVSGQKTFTAHKCVIYVNPVKYSEIQTHVVVPIFTTLQTKFEKNYPSNIGT